MLLCYERMIYFPLRFPANDLIGPGNQPEPPEHNLDLLYNSRSSEFIVLIPIVVLPTIRLLPKPRVKAAG
jgi:hypothetical protein